MHAFFSEPAELPAPPGADAFAALHQDFFVEIGFSALRAVFRALQGLVRQLPCVFLS